MKKDILCLLIAWVLSFVYVYGQEDKKVTFVDADRLTITGKAMPTPASLFHRIDTAIFSSMSPSENQQARCGTGLAIAFTTNSPFVDLHPVYRWEHKKDNITGIAAAGFDLYIKKDDKWTYAGSGAPRIRDSAFTIVANMDTTEKECLLYLPLYSELEDLKIGIQADASIRSIPNPFKHKIIFFGSSYTQGTSASRSGMSYPMQLQRSLNLDVCNLGFAGNSKLQPYFADMLVSLDAEAIVLDAFSNPNEKMIRERLIPFFNILIKHHKDIPIIFVETIHRGNTNFNLKSREYEAQKRKAAQELMSDIVQKYDNVYFLDNPLPQLTGEDTSADGVHPSDLGYYRWAEALRPQLAAILKIK